LHKSRPSPPEVEIGFGEGEGGQEAKIAEGQLSGSSTETTSRLGSASAGSSGKVGKGVEKSAYHEQTHKGMPPVAIVVVTWNGLAYTKTCIESILELTDYPAFELIVVDNGSTDGTLEYLRSLEHVKLISNEVNLGFSKGANIGIAAASPDSDIVILNNDIKITDPQWLQKLAKAAHTRETIGIVGCRLVFPDGTLNHTAAYVRPFELFGENEGGTEDDIGQATETKPVEAVIGAVMYIKRSAIDKLGGFDESYFSYFEDSDLCYRAAQAGFEVLYCGEVTLEHLGSASLKENRYDFDDVFQTSRAIFVERWKSYVIDERRPAVEWWSTLHQPIGYANMTRHILRQLWKRRVYVTYRHIYADLVEPNTGDPLIDDIKRLSTRSGALKVAASPAEYWRKLGDQLRVGYTMLEVDGIPQDWVELANKCVEVWVPTSFNEKTFGESGVKRPIFRIPLGVDLDYFNPNIRPYRRLPGFTFLSLFDWGERKAPDILIKAFNEEFSADDDVCLVIACTNTDPAVSIQQAIETLKLRKNRAPIIIYVNPRLEGYQMGSLYRSADSFVLPTKGEGFGLPILEAMACGLPVIATDWSGHTDFFDEQVGYPIHVEKLEPAIAKCPYYQGFRWALPDFEHLRFLMRYVYEHPGEAKAKGLKAAARARNFSWANTAALIAERAEALNE
jgi:GT2 family glycosyltransferase